MEKSIYQVVAISSRACGVWSSPKVHKRIGAELAAIRKECDLTQKGLADYIKKPQSFVSSYESGQRRLDLSEFSQLANAIAYLGDYMAHYRVRGADEIRKLETPPPSPFDFATAWVASQKAGMERKKREAEIWRRVLKSIGIEFPFAQKERSGRHADRDHPQL